MTKPGHALQHSVWGILPYTEPGLDMVAIREGLHQIGVVRSRDTISGVLQILQRGRHVVRTGKNGVAAKYYRGPVAVEVLPVKPKPAPKKRPRKVAAPPKPTPPPKPQLPAWKPPNGLQTGISIRGLDVAAAAIKPSRHAPVVTDEDIVAAWARAQSLQWDGWDSLEVVNQARRALGRIEFAQPALEIVPSAPGHWAVRL